MKIARSPNISKAVYHEAGQASSTPVGQQAEQQTLADQMQGLEAIKKVKFCLYKLGQEESGKEDKALTIQDYWPELAPLEELPPHMQEELAKQLAAEVDALERMGPWAQHGVTLRDKLGLYGMVLARMEEWEPAALDRPCTWARFKGLVAKEVEAICRDE